jgi:hypothetical protein
LTTGHGADVEYEVILKGLSAVVINRLFSGEASRITGQETNGVMDDGREFAAKIGGVSSIGHVDGKSIKLTGTLSTISFTTQAAAASAPEEWIFKLSNLKLSCGEVRTDLPLPASAPPGAEPGWSLDSIVFQAAGRQWRLTDEKTGDWSTMPKAEMGKPIISGTLRTPWRAADKEEDVVMAVQDICDVLSAALSRSIGWVSFALHSKDQGPILERRRAAPVVAFERRGMVPIDNFSFGVLKSFLELALPQVAANRDWLRRTLRLLLQAQIAEMLEVKCSVLYTLAERLSSHIVGKAANSEIDADLESRARDKDFTAELHQVLEKLSPKNWTKVHTSGMVDEIVRRNKAPSFVKKIQRACQAVDLPQPDGSLLRPRNSLLHNGELNMNSEDTVAHYLELDWVVLAMTLRLFAYDGVYYHPKFGHETVVLKEQLVSSAGAV